MVYMGWISWPVMGAHWIYQASFLNGSDTGWASLTNVKAQSNQNRKILNVLRCKKNTYIQTIWQAQLRVYMGQVGLCWGISWPCPTLWTLADIQAKPKTGHSSLSKTGPLKQIKFDHAHLVNQVGPGLAGPYFLSLVQALLGQINQCKTTSTFCMG